MGKIESNQTTAWEGLYSVLYKGLVITWNSISPYNSCTLHILLKACWDHSEVVPSLQRMWPYWCVLRHISVWSLWVILQKISANISVFKTGTLGMILNTGILNHWTSSVTYAFICIISPNEFTIGLKIWASCGCLFSSHSVWASQAGHVAIRLVLVQDVVVCLQETSRTLAAPVAQRAELGIADRMWGPQEFRIYGSCDLMWGSGKNSRR